MNEFYQVLPGFYWLWMSLIQFYRILSSFNGVLLVLLFIQSYWVLMGFTGFLFGLTRL